METKDTQSTNNPKSSNQFKTKGRSYKVKKYIYAISLKKYLVLLRSQMRNVYVCVPMKASEKEVITKNHGFKKADKHGA